MGEWRDDTIFVSYESENVFHVIQTDTVYFSYTQDFREHEISGTDLLKLSAHDLRNVLYITNVLDQQKLTMEITKLRVIHHKVNIFFANFDIFSVYF